MKHPVVYQALYLLSFINNGVLVAILRVCQNVPRKVLVAAFNKVAMFSLII